MRRRSGGNTVLETALFMPVLMLLIVGIIQFGKITYTYYALRNIVYTAARYIAVEQGVNFCDLTDPSITNALNFAVTGTTDASGTPLVANLTPDMLQVSTECVDSSGAIAACDTSQCGSSPTLAQRPAYIVVSFTNGYPVTPRIPFITLSPFVLTPTALVPFGGTT